LPVSSVPFVFSSLNWSAAVAVTARSARWRPVLGESAGKVAEADDPAIGGRAFGLHAFYRMSG
jgi:hypothetical protein